MLLSRNRWRVSLGLLLAIGLIAWWLTGVWQRAAQRDAALQLVEARRWTDAIAPLEAVLAENPHDVEVLAALYRAKMNTSEIVAELEPLANRLCELEPRNPVPFVARSELLVRLNRYDDALADGLKVLELNPTDHTVRRTVVNLAFELGQAARVEEECQHLRNTGQLDPEEYVLLVGNSALRARNFKRVQDVLTGHARELKSPRVNLLRAQLLAETEQHAQAVPLLEAALPKLELADRFLAYTTLANCQVQLQQPEAARKSLDQVALLRDAKRFSSDARQLPQRLDRQLLAARALLKVGEPGQAAQLLEGAAQRGLLSRELWDLLAQAYDALQQPERARLARQRALQP